jgi:TP901 family phage tail tape measure protein
LLNVSEFESADEASEALISTMQAYGYAAEDSMHVVDILNEIGNNFAISSDGLATALQDSASSLMAAGNSLEQSVAMVAAANKVLQDPNSVGSALRTISLRIRGTSVKVLEEMGEETDGVIESVSKLQAKVKGLSGVDILTDTGAYKDTYTIIKEIGQVWEQMNDIDRAALLELLAGKNRSNAMAALLTNMEDLEGAYESAMEAQGSAEAENKKYMNSIQGRIDQFTNALQTMWKNAIDSNFVKFIVSVGTGLVKVVNWLGMIPTILGTIAGAMSAIKGQNLFVNLTGNGKSGIITELIQKVKEGIPAIREFNSIQGVDNQAKFLNSLKETNPELSNYITKVMSASAVTTENGVATNIASVSQKRYIGSLVAAKVASIGLKVATVALNAALTIGISLLISGAISAISKVINGVKEAKEETKRLTEELKQQQAEIKSNISSLESLKDEFDKLSKGVDEYGNNISLSTEEYAKYKSIVEQIFGYTPTLISGYDKEGNAIANKNSLIEKSIELLKEERKQKLLELVTDDKLKVAYDSAKENHDKAKKKLKNVNVPSTLAYSGVKIDDNGKEHSGYVNQIDKYIEDVIGVEKSVWESLTEYIARNSDAVRKNIGKIIERSGQTKDGWKGLNDKQQAELLNYLNNVLSGVRETDAAWDSFIQTLQLVPQISTYYDKLSDSQKSFISSYINGLGDLSNKTEAEINNIKTSILSLTNAIGSDKEAQSLIDQLFSIDSNLSAKEYSDKISEIFNKLVEKGIISNDNKQKFIEQLFPDLKDIETMQEDVKKKIKDDQQDLVNSLNVQDLKIAYSIDASDLSFDELKKKIQEVKVATIGDFDISNYSDSISSLSENIGVLQAALEKLNSGSFTMDDYVKLIKDFPKLAKGVDVSSKSFKGLTSNLVRAIKASPKSMVKDLKALKLQLMQTGRSTSDIDQLIYSLEHMPENALDSMITKYATLADNITEATEAQNELKAAMEENPNEGFETRGEAMDYMKEAMSRGEIGSESNLWNVAEKYGFTFDSAKSINENADALAKFIATREKWFKQDDDGNYTYEGTEDFIKKVDAAVASMPELQELMKWDYNESTGVLDFDFKNKDWDQIVKYLSTCEGLIGLTSDEWADMLVQVGQYFNIDWSNYNDELEYLKKITTEDMDNKTKVEKYGSAMQEYFGKDSSIDLANRPMISSSKMNTKGWDIEDGSYATVLSRAYSNEGETVAITVTPILPDGEVLTEDELTKYATEIVNGADPVTYEFEVNGKTYTGEDIILAKHNGKNPIEEAKEYGKALHEAQEEYDKLRDTLNINTTIDEKGINGLSEIKEIQGAIQKNADGTTIIDEQAFRKALTSAEYTEDQIDLIIDKIKYLNKEAFASDTFNIGKILDKETGSGIDGLLEIKELQDAIEKDANTGFTVIDTDMFTSVLSEAGYTKAQIDELIQKIQEYENVVSVAGNTDPLGLSGANLSIDTLKASLSTLGVFFEDTLGDWFDGKRDLVINVPNLVSTLKEKGWSEEAIRSYCEQLSKANIEGFNIKVNSQEIDEALAKSDDVPEEKTTNYEVTGNGATTLDGIEDTWSNVTKDKTTNYTINETTVKKTVDDSPKWYKPWTWFADGTANAQGNWGAERTETSLVGELGPELRVRGSRWEMLGENGAEFTDVKKGDIIFNHKQTEELLKNGHITGRGKAYANGTAYAAGDGTFSRYNFSGNGGYTKYDVNNSIVDSFGNAASSVSDAADDISDAADKFEEVFDWFEVLLEEIEDNISLMNAKLENAVGISAKKGIYSEILNTEQFKLQELYEGVKLYSDYANKLLAKVPDQYKEMAKNGAVAITDFLGEANEEVVDSINNYREWAKKVSDLNQQLEETKKTIADTHVEIQNMLKDEYDNRISLITSVNDRIQDTIDLLDEEGKRSSAVMYEEMIKNSTKQLSELQSKRAEMQRALDEAVRSGDVARESSQWYEMVNAINDVDSEINDCRIDLESFQNSINQLHWDNFEKFIDAIDNVGNEISNLGDLIDEEDIVDEVGNWTDKGITALGLYAQEMERAKYRAEQYGKEIEYLNQEYAAGKYSEDEYLEKLQELRDGQWDSIKSYEAAKKAIVDLNKTRIEAIKNGIQKEIDAYSELIDKKKEELSLQKESHDFQKQVAEQQKNIANIQKQLAAMAGDNSASAIARKKQLEAELAAAQEELDELYYNHSVEKQQEALDKSLENYQDNKQDEMDALDESLKNEEQIIADSYATITANTESVAQTLSDIASQYGITLSDSVMQPWLDGANAIGTYQEQLDTSMSSFTQQLEALKQMYADLQNQADSAGKSMVDAINGSKSKTEGATYTPPIPSQPSTPSKPSKPSAPSTGSSVTVKKSATRFSRDGGNGTRMQSWVPGSTFTVYQVSGSEVLIGRNGQYTGWVRLSDIEGYAKGTKEIQNNQLAMLDELGDELVLHAGKNGRLEYLTKGTSVVPADITSNLMKLGSLDPKDILERNRPSIGAPHVIDNSIELKMEFGSLVHVDTVSNDTLPYLQKMVRNEFDNCMKHVNQGLKKFVR